MISYKPVIGRVVLLAAVACAAALYMSKRSANPAQQTKVESPYFIEYSKDYVIARLSYGVYERYERKGHDGLEECMQIAENFGQVYMDGADGRCDEWADTIINRYNNSVYLRVCEDKEDYTSYCDNKLFELFKKNHSIDKINELWNEHRYGCEGKCKLPIILEDL